MSSKKKKKDQELSNLTVVGLVFEYKFGEIVYLKTDPEQTERMITGVVTRPHDKITYMLTAGTDETDHYDIEISREKDIVKSTTN